MSVRIISGDCRERLRELPAGSVQCCVTSPPYFGLRDYGVAGQIGLEDTPDAFVAEMVAVFREVRRVLRDDGVLWLNLGDSYSTSSLTQSTPKARGGRFGSAGGAGRAEVETDSITVRRPPGWTTGLKPKDLIGIPWRVAFALQADGWWLRQDIIWHKPNPMPESVTDRCTKAHEYLFLLTKSATYHYDAGAIAEAVAPSTVERLSQPTLAEQAGSDRVPGKTNGAMKAVGGTDTRNRRSVWTVATQPFSEAHFATFPPALIEPCILAGTSEKGCCPQCGAPWLRLTSRGADQPEVDGSELDRFGDGSTGVHRKVGGQYQKWLDANPKRTTGFEPTCDCPPSDPVPCTVLDPFGGAGTTGLVADRLGRDAILIELNPEYAAMAHKRIHSDAGLFAAVEAA